MNYSKMSDSDPEDFLARQALELGDADTIRKAVQGSQSDRLMAILRELDQDLPEWADEFVFGKIWSRRGVSLEDRMIVAITALASTGHELQLRTYLHGALQAGIGADRIQEWLVMLIPYVGFPTTVSAMTVWKEVLAGESNRSGLDA